MFKMGYFIDKMNYFCYIIVIKIYAIYIAYRNRVICSIVE